MLALIRPDVSPETAHTVLHWRARLQRSRFSGACGAEISVPAEILSKPTCLRLIRDKGYKLAA